jgi:PKD repeat protein
MKALSTGICFLLFSVCALWPNTGFSQCVHQGVVLNASSIGGCGYVVAGSNGALFPLATNLYQLEAGDEILFNYAIDLSAGTCSLGSFVDLTCVQKITSGTGNPCEAAFSMSPLQGDALEFVFHPSLSAGGLFSYSWDFGDGNSSDDPHPVHTFQEPGFYEICLLSINPEGCTSYLCETLEIESVEVGNCGVMMTVDQAGDMAFGSIYNLVEPNTDFLEVNWTANPGEMVIGTGENFGAVLSDGAVVQEICATYTALAPDGSTCTSFICQSIAPDPYCADPAQVDMGAVCPPTYNPVCGCDGITYTNACEAVNYFGIASYTPGPCPVGANSPTDCQAYFSFEKDNDFSATFWDQSMGDYTDLEWEVSGIPIGTTNLIELNDQEEGLYQVCLTISGGPNFCESTFCQEVFLGLPENLCQYTDCVWPGDIDNDGKANIYDLLHMGLGHGSAGVYRPEATIQWQGQYASDWGMMANVGVDYKHLDADGDGQVTDADMLAIDLNYNPPLLFNQPSVAGQPALYLEFHQDTIVFDQDSPAEVLISADIVLGTPTVPALDIHGLALQVVYPQQDLVLPHSASVTYNENSFLGWPGELLTFQQDLYAFKRIDAAFSRKGGITRNGHSVVGTVDFIVVSDIIGGRNEDIIEFVLTIEGARMLNGEGEPLDYELPVPSAVLYILNNFPTSTVEPVLEKQWTVFPNPADEEVVLDFGELSPEWVRVQSVTGQEVWAGAVATPFQSISTASWSAGVYLVEMVSEEGRSVKKLVVGH